MRTYLSFHPHISVVLTPHQRNFLQQMETLTENHTSQKAECGAESRLTYLQHSFCTEGSGIIAGERARVREFTVGLCLLVMSAAAHLRSHQHGCLHMSMPKWVGGDHEASPLHRGPQAAEG